MSYLLRVLRYVILWFDLLVLTFLLYALTFVPLQRRPFFPVLFRLWCRLFVRSLGVELSLHQKNIKPLPDHYILIANHPSIFEDIGIPALFDVVCLAKREVGDWWVFGRIARAAGTVFVRREDTESRKKAIDRMAAVVASGKNFALYPEGGCTGRRINPRFYYGAFDLSMRTGVPIVPVFLHYEAQESFEWGNQTGPEKVKDIFRAPNRQANYYVFDAINPEDFADKQAYMDHAHELYLQWQARYLD
ncbi:MAG: lysophospholipid acyltransferase family protein [Salinisphaeraceae bacterium]|nr:lysophospholipid acyltransferase family protein [Salinisphaeraceae bacterium]